MFFSVKFYIYLETKLNARFKFIFIVIEFWKKCLGIVVNLNAANVYYYNLL